MRKPSVHGTKEHEYKKEHHTGRTVRDRGHSCPPDARARGSRGPTPDAPRQTLSIQAAGIDNASQLDIDLLDATNEKLGTITEQIAEIRIVLGKDLRPEDTAGR